MLVARDTPSRQEATDMRAISRSAFLSASLGLALVACQTTPRPSASCPTVGTQAAESRPVVIDTDMGADDQMAILFLLQRPDVSVQAIAVSGTGLAHCGPGTDNAAGLVALAGAGSIPIACGRETPLEGTRAFPDEWRADSDNAGGLSLPDGEPPVDVAAPDLLAESISDLPGQIKTTLLALGPLTNVADLLQQHPDIADKIERIVIMGGALDVPGHVPLDRAFFRHLKQDHHTPEADALYEWLAANPGMMDSGLYLWDQLAAAILVNPQLATFRDVTLSVVTEEGPDSGGGGSGLFRAGVPPDGESGQVGRDARLRLRDVPRTGDRAAAAAAHHPRRCGRVAGSLESPRRAALSARIRAGCPHRRGRERHRPMG